MLTYKGSGTRWKSHINKHNKRFVTTLWYQLYDNVFDLVADALSMSKSFDIVNNESWLNLIPENGLDGSSSGESHPNFGKPKEYFYMYGKTKDLHPMYGYKASVELRQIFSNNTKGNKNPRYGKCGNLNPNFGLYGIDSSKYGTGSKYDVKSPTGEIYYNISIRILCDKLNLNYNSCINNLKRGYKGYIILKKY